MLGAGSDDDDEEGAKRLPTCEDVERRGEIRAVE
jgi:hypothetical protein